MNPRIIHEYQTIVSGFFIRETSDKAAIASLHRHAAELRLAYKDMLDMLTALPGDPGTLAYFGVMFYDSVETTNLRLVKFLARGDTPGQVALEELKEAKALQIAESAIPVALILRESHPDILWTAIQLSLLHAPEQSWASTTISKDDDTPE